MRIARIAHPDGMDFALVEGGGYVLVEDPFRTGPRDLHPLSGPVLASEDVRLLAPVTPRTVVGMAHNTGPADRALPPQAFLKPARSVIGPDEAIEIPAEAGRVDGEAELAAVIGSDGAVFGWTLANDVTSRDLQGHRRALGPSQGLRHVHAMRPLDRDRAGSRRSGARAGPGRASARGRCESRRAGSEGE